MVAHITTVTFEGLKVTKVDVQVQISGGLPAFIIVGLPDKAVAESKERVRAALNAIGLSLPPKRLVINLAPADVDKVGSHFDLPIAVAVLVAMKIIPQDAVENFFCMGELSLDASILRVSGILPASVEALANCKGMICPEDCGSEAAWAGDINVIAAPNLIALINHVKGEQMLSPPQAKICSAERSYPDMSDIKGQDNAKRALEIAAAGGHNLLMIGPPGAGKSMLASRLIGLLPSLAPDEILQVSMINSVAGEISDEGLTSKRPFRDPHHSTSMVAMVGGGRRAQPGEISLAHKGVLFLDELPEFNRDVLESLRQPLENGNITVARANSHVNYPARFQLVSAMNPCRCGYIDDPSRCCNRAPKCANEYQGKISGPLYDRIDLFIEVPALRPDEMAATEVGESTEKVGKRVAKAREIQQRRFVNQNIMTNAEVNGNLLEEVANPSTEGKALLMKAVDNFKISMRGYNRILRVSRTIADLAGSETIEKAHVAEAISFRQRIYK